MNFRKGSKRPLTPTSPPQNYGLRGQQIGSTCQAHLVRIPISISQTFLEQFVLVYIRVMANILTISISHTDECFILSISQIHCSNEAHKIRTSFKKNRPKLFQRKKLHLWGGRAHSDWPREASPEDQTDCRRRGIEFFYIFSQVEK